MKCLFVVPHYGLTDRLQIYDFPLGLAYVASAARKAGHDVFGLNMNDPDRPCPEEAFKDIDVVLTGGLCTHYKETKNLINMIRDGWPDIKIILGGGLFSSMPDLMHEMLKPDVGVIGEGEACINEILNDINQNRQTKTYRAEPIKNLADIERPDYRLFGIETYLSNQFPNGHYYTSPCDHPRSLAVIASRGCPFDCSFCYHPLGKGYRQRDPEEFLSEVEHLISTYDLNILCILDEVLGWKRERLEEIIRGLKRFKIHWMCQMRTDQVDQDLLKRMKEAGCYYISYGIESADNRVLNAMRKHITIEQTERALEWTWNENIGIQGNILMGDPSETNESLLRSFTWWFKNRRYVLNMIRLVPYPDSMAWRRMLRRGIDPKGFIENDCLPGYVRMHQISGVTKEFEETFWQLLMEAYLFAAPNIQCTTELQEDYPGDKLGTYHVEATCPWCKKVVTYNRFILGAAPYTRMICRHCYRQFLINVQKEFHRHGRCLRSGSKAYDEQRAKSRTAHGYP